MISDNVAFHRWPSSGFFARMRVLAAGVIVVAMQAASAAAHEVLPAIADLTVTGTDLTLSIESPVEGYVAGIDLGAVTDTNVAPEAEDYDALRALPPADLEQRFRAYWPQMAPRLTILADGVSVTPELRSITVPETGDIEVARPSILLVGATLPEGARTVEIGWDSGFGALVLRQMGVEAPYDGLLTGGATSGPIALAGGDAASGWETFFGYIPVGFDHIVPKGLDHILFVLGLFFLSTRLGPLLTQVSSFTAAHTVTLALGALGYVNVPGSIVEPIIAASIVYVAVENIISPEIRWWRPVVVFCFGLLHGLGFASVLGEFGLPEGAFVPALLGFNLGVEFGQLFVILVAFLLVGWWFRDKPWYRRLIAIPASVAIALVGGWWVVERTLLA